MLYEEVKLDVRDKKLLSLLDFNARMPYSQLAKQVGLSKQGTEYKVQNLVRKGVIKGFYPIINMPKLGYLYCRLSLVLQNTTAGKEQEVLHYLIQDKRFFWVFTTQGLFDMLVVMWAKTITEFKAAIDDLLSRYGRYIKSKNETMATDVIHYRHRYLLNQKETEDIHIKETQERVVIDELDKKILALLCEDARIPLIQIARQLKISAKVVAYRIKSMEQAKLIEGYRPIIDHNVLGYTYYKLWINIHYEDVAQIKRLYAYIKENSIVLYIVEGIGLPEDLDIEVMVRSNLELLNFIKDLRHRFPSLIGDYRTFMFMETKKVRYLPF